MLSEVRNYLDEVRPHLHLAPAIERQVISELYAHFREEVAELGQGGVSEKEAARQAIQHFGRARVVARLMYEAYSKGSWTDAWLAFLPHLFVAGLFAFHLWNHYLLTPLVFISIVGITLFGWWHGKPNWLYCWVGYSLLPILIVGYSSWFVPEQAIAFSLGRIDFMPSVWLLVLVLVFYALSLWVIVLATIPVVKRDWVLASLMLVPLPIIGCWLFNIEQAGSFFSGSAAGLHQWDVPVASSLVVLGVTSATFIRLRRRALKAGALITVGSIALMMVAHNLWGDLGFFALLAFALSMLVFLFIPALLEAIIGLNRRGRDVWQQDNWIGRPSLQDSPGGFSS